MNYYCIFRGELQDINNAIEHINKDPLCHNIISKRNPQILTYVTYKSSNKACVDQAAFNCCFYGLTPVGGMPCVHSTPI